MVMRKTKRNLSPGGLKAITSRLKDLEGREVRVGSLGPAAQAPHIDRRTGEPGLGVAKLLSVHEYGDGVPERPVLRITVASQRPKFAAEARKLAVAALAGNVDSALDELGKGQSEEVVATFMAAEVEALSEATLADTERDPRGIPLVDTEQILSSIGHEVK